jgi:hypothetical protein
VAAAIGAAGPELAAEPMRHVSLELKRGLFVTPVSPFSRAKPASVVASATREAARLWTWQTLGVRRGHSGCHLASAHFERGGFGEHGRNG